MLLFTMRIILAKSVSFYFWQFQSIEASSGFKRDMDLENELVVLPYSVSSGNLYEYSWRSF
jgi:hypothetical protein